MSTRCLVRLPELVDQVGIRLGGDDAVTELVEHAGVLDCEVRTTVVDVAALPQQADDLDGLGQHLVTPGRARPPPPTTCSLSRSPAPSPRVKRPSLSRPIVAAFGATTAGW
jgi:hypothetical protein